MPVEILRASSIGTLQVAEFALEHGARMVLASTSEVYGEPEVHPQPEGYRGNVSTTGPAPATTRASGSPKRSCPRSPAAGASTAGIARIFNTYGPRMRLNDGHVMANFVVQALCGQPLSVQGSGRQTRSFCYVEDQVRGLVALMGSGRNGPFNIGNDEEYSVLELAHMILELTGSTSTIEHLPLPQDDPSQRRPGPDGRSRAAGLDADDPAAGRAGDRRRPLPGDHERLNALRRAFGMQPTSVHRYPRGTRSSGGEAPRRWARWAGTPG